MYMYIGVPFSLFSSSRVGDRTIARRIYRETVISDAMFVGRAIAAAILAWKRGLFAVDSRYFRFAFILQNGMRFMMKFFTPIFAVCFPLTPSQDPPPCSPAAPGRKRASARPKVACTCQQRAHPSEGVAGSRSNFTPRIIVLAH